MRGLPFVFASLAISGCGALLGSSDDVEAPVRSDPDSGTPGEADATTATGETDGTSGSDAGGSGDASADASADALANADAAAVVKHVFVTRGGFTGAFGSRAAADTVCRNAAIAAGRGSGTWKAYLADLDGANPADRIEDREWKLYNGWTVFTKGPKTNVNPSTGIAIDETGLDFGSTPDKYVWTGLANATPANQRTCLGWSAGAGASDFGGFGDMFVGGGAQWHSAGPTASCNETYRLYCFED